MADSPVDLEFEHDNRVARVRMSRPPANILDRPMVDGLSKCIASLSSRHDLVAIVIEAQGDHFSYGASIEEHLPGEIGDAMTRLRHLLLNLCDAPAPTLAAIRGRCLGGGLELVLGCDLAMAEDNAEFACPEIKLGVFPAAAGVLLPLRCGGGPTAGVVRTGETLTPDDARTWGLIQRVVPATQLEAGVQAWLEESFLPRPAHALRHTAAVMRQRWRAALEIELPRLESIYVNELMNEPGADEGIQAFLEKRPPRWPR